MAKELLHVPASLLLSRDLTATAKLIWMVARLKPKSGPAGTTWLSKTAGLSRTTVLSSMAQLQPIGCDPTEDPGGATTPVPRALLTNRKLGVHARVLYGILLLTPGYRHPRGSFTKAELADVAQFSPNTVTKAAAELVQAEWITLEQPHRLAPIAFELTFPGLARGLVAIPRAELNLNRAAFYGEGLMREYLSLLIDSEEYEDNASPGFLINPRTEEPLQFDRYYPPKLAFEFNGSQHYEPSEKYPIETVRAQQVRDVTKRRICLTRGITLVVVHAEDLTLKGMQQKIKNLSMPLRDLAGDHLLIDYLEAAGKDHRVRISRYKP